MTHILWAISYGEQHGKDFTVKSFTFCPNVQNLETIKVKVTELVK